MAGLRWCRPLLGSVFPGRQRQLHGWMAAGGAGNGRALLPGCRAARPAATRGVEGLQRGAAPS